MNKQTQQILAAVPQQKSRSDGPRSQLTDLTQIAEKFGLNHASEYLKILLSRPANLVD